MTSGSIRRILVALDPSPGSEAALRAAAEIAAALGAELEGIFVEDTALLRLAHHPAGREIGSFTARLRPLVRPELERQMRIQARRLGRLLDRVAEATGVERRFFRVSRGAVGPELLAAAGPGDLLATGRGRWGPRVGRGLGVTVEVLLARRREALLIVDPRRPLRSGVVVVDDGTERAPTARRWAGQLAEALGSRLTILVAGGVELTGDTGGSEVRIRRLGALTPGRVSYAVCEAEGGLLVLPPDSPLTADETLVGLLDRAGCPILVAPALAAVREG